MTQDTKIEEVGHTAGLMSAANAVLKSLRSFAEAPSDDLEDQRWHFEVLPAMRSLEAAIRKAEGRAS